MTDGKSPMINAKRGLAEKVIRFAGFLKSRGFRVFQSSVHDSLRCLEEISLGKKEDFFVSLRSNLVSTDLEWIQFRDHFDQFWIPVNDGEKPDKEEVEPGKERLNPDLEEEFLPDDHADLSAPADITEKKGWLEGVAYSPVSMVEKKDLGRFDMGDVQVAQLALKKMMEQFKVDISRRSRRGRKCGNIDFPRVIRKSLKTGGIPFELFHKQKKKRLKRLVIIADVSGSMDRYARFVMPFLLGLRGVGSRAEVFVFSTSLTPITFMIRHLDVEKALERIAMEVPDWSGGTRIGYSLHQFNEGYGERLNNRRTVVVLLSDGWDLGGKDLLRREMVRLSSNAYSVIWLNPLAGDPDYEPLCKGMRSALPYINYFLPADSLYSLKRVGRLLSGIMIH